MAYFIIPNIDMTWPKTPLKKHSTAQLNIKPKQVLHKGIQAHLSIFQLNFIF